MIVRSRPGTRALGVLAGVGGVLPCALGRAGFTAAKREGDGGTPVGRWPMRAVWYRADRIARPRTRLPVRAIREDDGWCDAPEDPNYNRPVRLPYPASAEKMWRDDRLYDLVVELGYNDCPRSRWRGSAIFMHVAREGFAPTDGCLALRKDDLVRLLAYCGRRSFVDFGR